MIFFLLTCSQIKNMLSPPPHLLADARFYASFSYSSRTPLRVCDIVCMSVFQPVFLAGGTRLFTNTYLNPIALLAPPPFNCGVLSTPPPALTPLQERYIIFINLSTLTQTSPILGIASYLCRETSF